MSPSTTLYPPKPISPLSPTSFVQRLIAWYQANHRELPWRNTQDPYKIWLSEVILQQTRVAQGLPYYQRFVAAYPTVIDLANAPEEAVMRLWQGLGYYTRARNMHACARTVATQLGGRFPDNYRDLLCLKGIGKYTAAAIAAIAFQEPVPAVDGNVYRVLGRIFGIEADISTTQGTKVFAKLAQSLVPLKNVATYTQAIMEFGALHCTPKKPQCLACPFQANCVAFHTDRQHTLPVKSKKIKIKKRFLNYFVLQYANQLYMRRRPSKGIWAGLYDFYLVETVQPQDKTQLDDTLVALLQRRNASIQTLGPTYKHVLTHQQLYVNFFYVAMSKALHRIIAPRLPQLSLQAYTLERIHSLPKPILINNFLESQFYH